MAAPEGRDIDERLGGTFGAGGGSEASYSELGHGGVAQLVERYVRNVEVGGSSPLTSTAMFPGQGG
jgi:hypothetical protein